MRNKQHKHILKAFLNTKVPTIIKQNSPDLVLLDTVIGGYCTQLLKKEKIDFISNEIITTEEDNIFLKLINNSLETEKEEIEIYYQLIKLVELILLKYK